MNSAGKIFIISVISDLVTDQRVHRTADSLRKRGMNILLVGRKMKSSLEIQSREYKTHRFSLPFEKGPLFYASYNIRLFFFLLFRKVDVLVSNDLDTLLPNFLISRIKRIPLFYDSHEYFTEVPELQNRRFVKLLWMMIERKILPRLKNMYTVNDSIADLYRKKYGIDVSVIRNLPAARQHSMERALRSEYGLPESKRIFLFQGAGINIHRGAEEALEAMLHVNDAVLLFIGSGDVIGELKRRAVSLNLSDKVFFIPKVPLEKLRGLTRMADAGLTLDRDSNINYKYSLPNKLFDYIHAGLPVLASDLPEVRNIVEKYNIGMICKSHDPVVLAEYMNNMFFDKERLDMWRENLKLAASDLNWEKEEEKLYDIYRDVL
ncbi:MAG: glycosyltransferase [Bacteroidetes bacterium]|nr:MAG: glycosyltransferase [Bacteroidota bacterium]REK05036.1 MAG: glycosyltransferase [Bacteroidota bacterium]REK36461.1 MAG: glycosyltransferase [Bacteroidota bacterium]REK51675.1 MAG: glycosyltransferase [Bacteroidota bacterium]